MSTTSAHTAAVNRPSKRKLPDRWRKRGAYQNPAVARIMDADSREAETRFAELRAWLDANEPPIVPPGTLYSQVERMLSPNKRHTSTPEEWELQRYTLEYLKRQLGWHPAPNTTWRDYAVEAASRGAYDGLSHLTHLISREDQHALSSLADIATAATRTLGDLSRQAAGRVRPIARRRFLWPFLKARKERFGDEHRRTVKEIQLGDEVLFSGDALARTRENHITGKTAIAYLCRLEDCRKPPSYFGPYPETDWQKLATKLKPFGKGTWKAWFEVLWQAVLADYSGHPEKDPRLKQLGLYRAEHSYEIGAQQKTTPRTREANLRDGIKEKLKAAIERLAVVKKSNK
jgi:hypothetical protein